MNNLRHASEDEPNEDAWSPLGLSVAEGFYKTDVLMYASICEAALFSVIQDVYKADPAGAHESVKDCFRRIEDKFQHLCDHEMDILAAAVKGRLCLRFKKEIPLPDRDVSFASLIEAGESIGMYGSDLRARLDRLRDDRNTIHLAKQIQRHDEFKPFEKIDRARAKVTTERLRVALVDFLIPF